MVLTSNWQGDPGEAYFLQLGSGRPVRLAAKQGHFWITIQQRFQLLHTPNDRERGPYRVTTRAYNYTLAEDSGGDEGQEIMAFQWDANDGLPFPHMHLSFATGALRAEFQHAHIPTGRVAVEDFLEFIIRDFGVTPLRESWRNDLQRSRDSFRQYKTW